jgi:precorrin-3B C17-methyltransferase
LKNEGKIFVVGIGPGESSQLTEEAKKAIASSQSIVGYKKYIQTIKCLIEDKDVYPFAMKQEIDRVQKAIDLAKEGRIVAIISSGDPGIYAMAGPILQLLSEENNLIDVQVIPGISALNMSAAQLGAPLMHDFAVVSLSDLLTPLNLIKKRIEAAAQADFVIAIYNPKSKGRPRIINEAQNIILKYRDKKTPVGIVRKINGSQESTISCLGSFTEENIDMLTTVIIGNSQTFISKNRMITPRGYTI